MAKTQRKVKKLSKRKKVASKKKVATLLRKAQRATTRY